ncbi:MAG: YbgC/FadM family acyl-CoA thioesterase [Gammaproteobacteria bacterium]|nr:YbgC/FadM family acyl-CoA thioesterase [Gammaproteobacteria bacterium]
MKQYHFPVQVYYEDTDHSGVVYYANYLKYMERAREEVLGVDLLIKLWEEQQIGFAVYSVNVKYTNSAIFGDRLDVRTTFKMDSPYRAILTQDIWKENATKPAITGIIELICIDKNNRLLAFEEVMAIPV